MFFFFFLWLYKTKSNSYWLFQILHLSPTCLVLPKTNPWHSPSFLPLLVLRPSAASPPQCFASSLHLCVCVVLKWIIVLLPFHAFQPMEKFLTHIHIHTNKMRNCSNVRKINICTQNILSNASKDLSVRNWDSWNHCRRFNFENRLKKRSLSI